jgi:hypothetical protein
MMQAGQQSPPPWTCGSDLIRDAAAARAYVRDGYVVADFIGAATADRLREIHAALPEKLPQAFNVSLFSADTVMRRQVSEAIKSAFSAAMQAYLTGYRPLFALFLEKRPGTPQGALPLHQDWTFVDESRMGSLNFWCPLEDVDETNGCLWVVPGSHHLPVHPRLPFGPMACASLSQHVGGHLIAVPMRKGQVMIHDHRLLHASNVNHGTQSRLATACVVVPRDADLLHYYRRQEDEPGRYRCFHVDEQFFYDYRLGFPPGPHYRSEVVFSAFSHFSAEDLHQAIATSRHCRSAAP